MSADETDVPRTAPKKYRIVEAQWQSDELKMFLRGLDQLYCEYCLTRSGGGNAPRVRVEGSGRSEVGHVPQGLWRNCYSEAYLRGLKPYQRKALAIVDEDYKFDLTPEPDSEDEEL